MKNKLAENLLRFGIKNLNESEVEKLQGLAEQSNTGSNDHAGIARVVNDILKGSNVQVIEYGDLKSIVFNGSPKQAMQNDFAVLTDRKSSIYYVSGNTYIVNGNIGKFSFDEPYVTEQTPSVYMFTTKPGAADKSIGNRVKGVLKMSNLDPAKVIANVALKLKGDNKADAKTFLGTAAGESFINNMIKSYKVIGMSMDILDDSKDLMKRSIDILA
jgi:hypothetical protein